MLPRRAFGLLKRFPNDYHLSFPRGRYTSFVLLASLLICSLPAPVLATALRDVITRSSEMATHTETTLAKWLESVLSFGNTQERVGPRPPAPGRGVTPPARLSRIDKEANVRAIQVNPDREV